jgi:RimJ/RimL family protein N-acetyltransferase
MPRTPHSAPRVRLLPVGPANWEAVVQLQPTGPQASFLPPVTTALLRATYEPEQQPWALYHLPADAPPCVVGFAVLARYSQVPWLPYLLIGQAHQGGGLGCAVLEALCAECRKHTPAHELRTSVDARNAAAERFFARNGFVRAGFADAKEFVMHRLL